MVIEAGTRSAVVVPTASAISALRPLGGPMVSLTGGIWERQMRTNRERTIPRGFEQLGQAGNLANFRLAAGAHGRYRAIGEEIGVIFPFLDTDVYKGLEAAGWELGRAPDPALARDADEAIDLIAAAQRPDGYLNTFVQVVAPGREYGDLAWGHELYSVGHLIQAAVAWQRALGDDRLLRVAIRAADSVDRELGPAGRLAIDGHPEIEMALVELYRPSGAISSLPHGWWRRAATGCSGPDASAPRTGRTTRACATRRRWPATRFASCTSIAAWWTSPQSLVTPSCSTRSRAAGATWWTPGCT